MQPPVATPWRRTMCVVYEAVILFGVVFFFAYGYSALASFKGHPGGNRWGLMGFLAIVLGAYFTYFWSDGRRTLPMKTLSLLLLDVRDRPITTTRALARYLVAAAMLLASLGAVQALGAPAAVLLAVPFGWMLFDRQRRTLHDVIAGTRMAVVPVAGRKGGLAVQDADEAKRAGA